MNNASLNSSKSWGIAVICSFINFLHLGIARQSGLLYLVAVTRYNATRSQASLPFVLCYTVRNVSGPLVGYLGRRIGLQPVIILGCLISSIGMGACFFAEDIVTVTIMWGGVFGLGFGMGSVLIPVVLNQYFDKYLSNANGIAFGGECVAGFVLPVLIKILLNAYGASGLFLILSGLMLHSIPAAMLLKTPVSKPRTTVSSKSNLFHIKCDESELFPSTVGVYNKSFDPEYSNEHFQIYSSHTMKNLNLKPEAKLGETITDNGMYSPNGASNKNELRIFYQRKLNGDDYGSKDLHPGEVIRFDVQLKDSNDMYKNNLSKCYGSLNSSVQSNENQRNLPSKDQTSAARSFRVFYDPAFILMLLTQSFFIFIATMIMTIIVDFCRDADVTTDEEIYILMCLSIADMIGRFGLGWITDKGYMSNVTFSAFCFFSLGVTLVALVFLNSFGLIMASATFIGLFFGGLLIVSPGVVCDHIENDKITMALASRYILFAPMSLTQSSMIGFFRGKLGSYNWIFYLLSAICLLCAILSLLIPFAAKFRDRKKKRTAPQSVENS